MTKINKPISQHYLPKTYLKGFVIDKKDSRRKSLIYCYWTNQYETKIKETGIGSEKFKIENFYTIESKTEPFVIENHILSQFVELLYVTIMDEVEKELNLTLECRENLIIWIYNNKFRNPAYRKELERVIAYFIEYIYALENNIEMSDELKHASKKKVEIKARKKHLDMLTDVDKFMKFRDGMGIKHWSILKSKLDNQFLTNDNPGFSINVELENSNLTADFSSLNYLYALDSTASNFFILSPIYCLFIKPFPLGTPLDISLHNQKIEFETLEDIHIDFVNHCTKETRTTYLISNDENLLKKHTKKNDVS